MAYPYAVKRPPWKILGHPSGLLTLFLTEVGERFSFYGMRAILVLFLVDSPARGGLGLDKVTAVAVLAVYTAAVYLLALPGGWVADRLTGTRRAVLVGGVVTAAGHYVLAVPAGGAAYLGLVLVAVGTGLLRPNIAAMVGELYDQLPDARPGRRDAGFSLFYLGINLGAWAGALVTAGLALAYGWPVGFGAAAVAMTLALVPYLAAGRSLGSVGREPHRPFDEYRRGLILRRAGFVSVVGLAALAVAAVLVAAATGHGVLDALLLLLPPIVLTVPIVVFAAMLREHTLTSAERSRILAYIPIFLGAAVFWLVYDQAALVLNRTVGDRLFGLDLPASWNRSVNPLLIVLLAPVFAWAWTRLGDRAPGTPVKFAIGLLGIGGAAGIAALAGAAGISPLWLLSVYLVQTLAELFIAPIGLSVTSQLAPARFASQLMGLWFLATAVGDALGGYLVRLNGQVSDAVYCGLLGGLATLAGLVFVLSAPRIRSLMAGVA